MKQALISSLLLLGAFLVLPTPASACSAAPPCGPIPVLIEIKFEKWKGLTFGDSDVYTLEGTVSYYVNIDNDGWWYDPQQEPKLTFKVNRQPPWVKATIDPMEYTVPVNDPSRISNEGGAPDQLQFYWEAPITVTVERLRDPFAEELPSEQRYIRSDGTYRVTISASSEGSLLAPDVFGPNMGLQEGYGVRELRFIPEIRGTQWLPNEEKVLEPADGSLPDKDEAANASSLAAVAAISSLAGIAIWRRRRG